MLDIKVLRERPEAAKAGAVKKHMPDRVEAVDRALALDAELRAMTPRLDSMRSEQKAGGKQLGKMTPEEREAFLQKQKQLKVELQGLAALSVSFSVPLLWPRSFLMFTARRRW